MTDHDAFCEAEYVSEAGGYTSCSCNYRRTRGLVAEHDRQVAERAWDEGYTRGNAHNGRRDDCPYRAAKGEQK